MESEQNQREFSRVRIPVQVELTCESGASVAALTYDVSLTGVRIPCDQSLVLNKTCDVKLVIGDQEPIEILATGQVVRADGSFVVVHFDSVEMESYPYLKNLILYNSHDAGQVEKELDEHIGLRRK